MRALATMFLKDESGSAGAEYSILAVGIAVAIATSLSMVGCSVTGLFGRVALSLDAM